MKLGPVLLLSCAALLSLGAQGAERLVPYGFFLGAGAAGNSTSSLTVGAIWPWSWTREWGGGEVGGLTEVFLSHWSANGDPQHPSFTHTGVLPLLRYGFSRGRSPWFVEGGVGLSWLAPQYRTQRKQFGSVFNFVDAVGIGRRFGRRRDHELSLRITHVSNGGYHQPNPGENLVQLRFASMF